MKDNTKVDVSKETIIINEFKLACIDYRRKICSKCNDKDKKIKNCSLLRGFKHSSCKRMNTAVKNRKNIKDMTDKYIEEMFEVIEDD